MLSIVVKWIWRAIACSRGNRQWLFVGKGVNIGASHIYLCEPPPTQPPNGDEAAVSTMRPLMKTHAAARLLGVSVRELNRMWRAGQIPFVPFASGVRFDGDEMARWVAENTVRPERWSEE